MTLEKRRKKLMKYLDTALEEGHYGSAIVFQREIECLNRMIGKKARFHSGIPETQQLELPL